MRNGSHSKGVLGWNPEFDALIREDLNTADVVRSVSALSPCI